MTIDPTYSTQEQTASERASASKMISSTCCSCRTVLQSRLRARISHLELLRRGFHVSAPTYASKKGSYITSRYVDTVPPSHEQLKAATHFFSAHAPTKSWTASEWRRHTSQHSDDLNEIVPEIAFLGRSNSGKSSLLNALLDKPGLCRVGPRPGKTITMHAWSLAREEQQRGTKKSAVAGADETPKVTVLDMPGYGHGSRSEWGQEIVVYMKRRRQLRRAFVLLNPRHGIKESDEQILRVLRAEGVAHQIVACKCDDVKPSELAPLLEGLGEEVAQSAARQNATGLVLGDVLAVGHLGDGRGNQKVEAAGMKGVDDVRWAMLQATGLEEYAVNLYRESLLPKEDKRPLRIIPPVREPPRTQTVSRSL